MRSLVPIVCPVFYGVPIKLCQFKCVPIVSISVCQLSQLCHFCQKVCANCANKCVPIVSMGVSEFVPAANNFQPYLFTNVRTKVSQQGTSDLKVASCQNFNQMKKNTKEISMISSLSVCVSF